MKKIESFTVDHNRLLPGIYVSRKDRLREEVLTTFDLRFTKPNFEPVMDTAGIHTIEHLGATFLRNEPEWKTRIIYFGPMGCRTGFYLILWGEVKSEEILSLIRKMSDFIIDYEDDIPGASAEECGNYSDQNLDQAKKYLLKFKKDVLDNPTSDRLNYK
jgi:S-ribosylhomocysteine lyase